MKSATEPSNPCTNSNGLYKENVKLNPFVKPFTTTKQYKHETFPSAELELLHLCTKLVLFVGDGNFDSFGKSAVKQPKQIALIVFRIVIVITLH